MNRHERRTLAAKARHALAAIRAELTPEIVVDLRGAPPDLLDELVALVATGGCSPAQAAEALSRAIELGDATVSGDISEAAGLELMKQLGDRHVGTIRGPN